MKRLLLFGALFLLCSWCHSSAQNRITGRIETEVVIPITVMETDPINFGRIVNSVEGGNVVLTPRGERSYTGNLSFTTNDSYGAGKFELAGSPNSLVAITLPSEPQKIFSSKNSQELTVSDFSSNIPTSGVVLPSSNGRIIISVGATLHVGNWMTAQAGKYYGTYEIMFTYN